jgi:multidrug efflux pump subunit AcrA (membrane-fusion protein)
LRARNKILLLAISIAVVVSVWVAIRLTARREIPVAVVERGEFRISILRSGEIKARRSVTVSAPTVGEKLVITRLIPEGTFVKKGDVLIEFDTTELLERLKSAERDLIAAEAELELTGAKNGLREKELLEEIRKKNLAFRLAVGASPVDVENARQDLELARAKYETELKVMDAEIIKTEANIGRSQERVASARKSLGELTVRAPIDGLVIHEKVWRSGRQVKVQEGDSPWPMQPILSLPDLRTLYVSTDVDEIDISRIEEGQTCVLTLEAYPDTSFTGRVGNVGNLARTKYYGSGPNVFDVQVDLDEIDPRFRPGMKARVNVIVDTFEDELSVPIEGVFSIEGETVVYVGRGRSFEKRSVLVGKRNDTHIIVRGGLDDSDEIALVNPFEKREE